MEVFFLAFFLPAFFAVFFAMFDLLDSPERVQINERLWSAELRLPLP